MASPPPPRIQRAGAMSWMFSPFRIGVQQVDFCWFPGGWKPYHEGYGGMGGYVINHPKCSAKCCCCLCFLPRKVVFLTDWIEDFLCGVGISLLFRWRVWNHGAGESFGGGVCGRLCQRSWSTEFSFFLGRWGWWCNEVWSNYSDLTGTPPQKVHSWFGMFVLGSSPTEHVVLESEGYTGWASHPRPKIGPNNEKGLCFFGEEQKQTRLIQTWH